VIGVTFGSNLLSHKLKIARFEVVNEAQVFVLAWLLRFEITRGKTRRQQMQVYWELEFFTWLKLDVIVTRPFFKIQPTVHYRLKTWTKIIHGRLPSFRSEPDCLRDMNKCRNIIKKSNLGIGGTL
jgi:hypothetical protein